MLYELFTWLEENCNLPGAGLWQYISFRAGAGMVFSLIISMLFGGKIINFLRNLQVGEDIRDLGLQGQMQKKGTPTMGGVIIIMGIVIPVLLVADLTNVYILVMLLVTTWMAIIGFALSVEILTKLSNTTTQQLKKMDIGLIMMKDQNLAAELLIL